MFSTSTSLKNPRNMRSRVVAVLGLAAAVAAVRLPVRVPGAPVMCATGGGYWEAKRSSARFEGARVEADLADLQERERFFLEQLQAESARARELEQRLELLGPAQQPAALAAGGEAGAAGPGEWSALRTAYDDLKTEFEELVAEREQDVQKTGAYWIERLQAEQEAHEATRRELEASREAEAAPSAGEPVAAPAGSAAPAGAARVEELERELASLEEDYDALSERLEVQQETISMASARLDQLADALEAQAYKAEVELQKTSAFWIERLRESDEALGECELTCVDQEQGAEGAA